MSHGDRIRSWAERTTYREERGEGLTPLQLVALLVLIGVAAFIVLVGASALVAG